MILAELQRELERIYGLGSQPPIGRFLISSADLRQWLPKEEELRPQVLLQEVDGNIFLAVHVGEEALDPKNLADFLSAAEETSHFLYLIWRAANEKPVSLLDLEVQGEIDKFLLASLHFPGERNLFSEIFEKMRLDEELAEEAKTRYLEAHRLGRKFLESLGEVFGRDGARPEILEELRAFYRSASQSRRARIARL